jgi:iron(III) transport system substrate-binding protein
MDGGTMMRRTFLIFAVVVLFSALGLAEAFSQEVVVYSSRQEHLIKPMFDAYTAKTGVKITYITDKEGPLLERLKAEGKNTPADMLITVDAGNLWHAAREGVLARVESSRLKRNIPAYLRDPGNRWFGLSVRARTIVYNKNAVRPATLSTYEALGDPRWKGRLVLRTSKKVYNQSLVASFIAEYGEDKAEKIVKAWVANLAAEPFSSDTKALEAVAAGVGDVCVVNTYYVGRLLKDKPDLPLAIFWPNQMQSGVHVNVSGAGITTHAKHRDEALRLLEWLSSPEAQNLFADSNMEYPANPKVKPHPRVAAWGDFKADPINVATYGEHQAAAVKLMDRAGYK